MHVTARHCTSKSGGPLGSVRWFIQPEIFTSFSNKFVISEEKKIYSKKFFLRTAKFLIRLAKFFLHLTKLVSHQSDKKNLLGRNLFLRSRFFVVWPNFLFPWPGFFFHGEVFFYNSQDFFQIVGIFTLWTDISVFSKEFVIISKKKRAMRRNSFCPIKPLIAEEHQRVLRYP